MVGRSVVSGPDADGAFVELFLEMCDEIVVLLDFLLTLLNLSFEVLDFSCFIIRIKLGLIVEFFLGLELPFKVEDFVFLFINVPLLLLDDVVFFLVLLLFLVVLLSVVVH